MRPTYTAPWFAVPGNVLAFSLAHNLLQENTALNLQLIISSEVDEIFHYLCFYILKILI